MINMNTAELVKIFRTAYDTALPKPLHDFIADEQFKGMDGKFITVEGKKYRLRFLSDMLNRMGGLVDQAIRVAISDRTGGEPIGFFEALPGDDDYFHEIAVVPRHRENRLDENDPLPVYLISFRGYPVDFDEDEHEDLEEEEDTFEFHIRKISASFEQFLKLVP